MTPQETRKTLIDRQTSEAAIAEKLGVSRSMVCHVIHWRRKTPFIRRGIANALGIPYEVMWGEKDPGIDRLRGESVNRLTVPDEPDADKGGS